jgi:hypothetical protein
MKWLVLVAAIAAGIAAAGCAHVTVDPIQVQTIRIQHDVTIGVDKALEDFFAFQEQQGSTTRASATTATTAPTTQTAQAPASQTAGDVP